MIGIVIAGIVAGSVIVGLLWSYEVSKRRAEWWREWKPYTSRTKIPPDHP